MTQASFMKLFNEKYLSKVARAEKIHEFLDLRKGKMMVAEQALKFEELARFFLLMVLTDEACRLTFMHKLIG